jgi:branched-chain amino acid transport system substrate-binding protein
MNTDRAIPSLINDMIKMGIKSAAVFKGEDDSSNTGSTTFIKECEKAGIKITIVTSFSSGDTDFSGQIAAMLNTRPDCIYMSTLNYMLGTFMKQVRGFGYNGLVLGKELFTTDQLGVARELANNYIFFAPYVTYPSIEACKEEPMKSFMIQYQKTYGRLPVHDCAFRAWDSMLALDAAINIAKSLNNEAIRNAVPKVKGVPGLGGILDFSSGDGEGLPSVKTYIIQNMNYLPLQSWIDQGDYDKLKAESGKK